ncbi:MAG: alanine racemase [Firmicutes bacterium]|nr:alanine racemase [Bacillota bacterium]
MYRKTYVEIDENILKKNIEEIKKTYDNYEYYIGVVKNNAYGHGIKVINSLIEGGINYLAVSSLEEAIEARKYNREIPILCLEVIDLEYIYDCINNNVTLTVESLDYLEELNKMKLDYEVKIHLKLNTGMNRLGINNKKEVNKCVEIIDKNKKIVLEGIYTHLATSGISDKYYDEQINKFKELTNDIDLSKVPIVHLGRSLTLVNHDKLPFVNGIRLGIIMFGFSQSIKPDNSFKGKIRELRRKRLIKKLNISSSHLTNDLKIKTAFTLYSTVMTIKKVKQSEFVGYGALYFADKDINVAIIPIGYADGVTKNYKYVYIHGRKYNIVADSMDMLMVCVDGRVRTGDKVEIFGDNISIKEASKNNGINSYKLFNMITTRVPRVHIKDKEKVEIKY